MTAEISAPGCQRWIPVGLVPLARKLWRNYKGFRLFLLYLTGRVPWHAFRLFVYRHLLHISIGPQSVIHWRTRFYAPGGIRIGHNTIIGYDAFLDGRYTLTIGNNVNLGGDVSIFTAQHDPNDPGFGMVGGPVVIEDYVYIGSRVTILPNLTVGRGGCCGHWGSGNQKRRAVRYRKGRACTQDRRETTTPGVHFELPYALSVKARPGG